MLRRAAVGSRRKPGRCLPPCSVALPDSPPNVRVNRQPAALAIPQVEETAVVGDTPVAEKPRQQGKSVLRERLIYKWLLLFDRLHRTAARERVV
ncbi:MAG TPA: hypothetical protein VIX19_15595, partial [Terriglobales bacterium]